MKVVSTELGRVQEILERKEAELDRELRKRDGIAIEKSADQMDEIQYATERELAMRNVDRESHLLRQVKAALARVHDGSFGACAEWPCPGRYCASSARRPPIGIGRRERNLSASLSAGPRE